MSTFTKCDKCKKIIKDNYHKSVSVRVSDYNHILSDEVSHNLDLCAKCAKDFKKIFAKLFLLEQTVKNNKTKK
ncbi:MAG: hypothetical protein V1825_01390 [Candidatus Falkowbacteria bacterium]